MTGCDALRQDAIRAEKKTVREAAQAVQIAADRLASAAMTLRGLDRGPEARAAGHPADPDNERIVQIALALAGIAIQASALANDAKNPPRNGVLDRNARNTRAYRVKTITDDTTNLAAIQATTDL